MKSGSANLLPLLKQHFGFASFRPLQEEIIRDSLAGRDVFALLPTGGGKSLCFQLPALACDGLTVVVSPLIALMKDQVDALQAGGIPATFLNSSLAAEESRKRLRGLHNGEFRLLYAAPERLMLPGFLSDLQKWNVRLVNRDELDVPALQVGEKAGEHQAFRRNVEQAIFAVVQATETFSGFLGVQRRVQKCRRDAAGLERVHLIFHQRDQRRDDDGKAVAGERGQLETQRFAAARGQQGEDIFARERILDDLRLQWTERREAEVLLQQREQVWRAGFQRGQSRSGVVEFKL